LFLWYCKRLCYICVPCARNGIHWWRFAYSRLRPHWFSRGEFRNFIRIRTQSDLFTPRKFSIVSSGIITSLINLKWWFPFIKLTYFFSSMITMVIKLLLLLRGCSNKNKYNFFEKAFWTRPCQRKRNSTQGSQKAKRSLLK
jgi:hypothetical protein